MRLFLSLLIAGIIVVSMLLQVNDSTINRAIDERTKKVKLEKLEKTSEYINYLKTVNETRDLYNKIKIKERCLYYAEIGFKKTIDIDKRVRQETNTTISGAPSDIFLNNESKLSKYSCGLNDNRPCKDKDCHEYNIQKTDFTSFKNKYKSKYKTLEEQQKETQKISDKYKLNFNDFSDRLIALYKFYENMEKENPNSFKTNIGALIPFMMILLLFELLPTVSKLTFPISAYDRLLSDEEMYYALKSIALTNKEARDFFDSYKLRFNDVLLELQKAQNIEYKHKEEVGEAILLVMSSFRKLIIKTTQAILFSKVTSILKFIVGGIIVFFVIFVLWILFTNLVPDYQNILNMVKNIRLD